MKVLAWYVLDPSGIEHKNHVKYPYSTSITKFKILAMDTQMVSKEDNTRPTLVKQVVVDHLYWVTIGLFSVHDPHLGVDYVKESPKNLYNN